jgi:hypothetical protein
MHKGKYNKKKKTKKKKKNFFSILINSIFIAL